MSTPARTTVVVRRHDDKRNSDLVRLLPAALISAVVHCVLFGFLLLLSTPTDAAVPTELPVPDVTVQDEPKEAQQNDPLVTPDIDRTAQSPQRNSNFDVDRIADFSVPGTMVASGPVGIEGADMAPLTNLPSPFGTGGKGQGGQAVSLLPGATTDGPGSPGGTLTGAPFKNPFPGRSAGTRERALITGGGTKESEAAVVRGLYWLKKTQMADGRWLLDGNFKDRGTANDTAGTALGLLPLLGAGKTHTRKDSDFDKPVEKALRWLINKQDRKTGYLGGGMYAHGLATIALCEAYGLTQDQALRKPAQMAVNYIVRAQHAAGGWRYSPGQAGDTSVVGWQVMALKSAQMCGLDVPDVTMRKATQYLNSCCNKANEGYGYVGPGATPTMTSVGLLCRQYLEGWGPANIRLIKGIDNHVKPYPPGRVNSMYYYYYATQVMHHFGGDAWKKWNESMRDSLVKSQEKTGTLAGSWNSAGDIHGPTGGRLMITSLSLLTLEVYYRHLPLYYRDAGDKMVAK